MLFNIAKRSNHLIRPLVSTVSQTKFCSTTSVQKDAEPRPDKLYRKIDMEVRSNDRAVIDSYIEFMKMAAQNLNIEFVGTDLIDRPEGRKYYVERQTCLRSAFVHKKHREQYEWRTYVKRAIFKRLTESTAQTFLEYVERNLPEGCSMVVHKFEAVKMFDHLVPPVEELESASKESEQPRA